MVLNKRDHEKGCKKLETSENAKIMCIYSIYVYMDKKYFGTWLKNKKNSIRLKASSMHYTQIARVFKQRQRLLSCFI